MVWDVRMQEEKALRDRWGLTRDELRALPATQVGYVRSLLFDPAPIDDEGDDTVPAALLSELRSAEPGP